MEFAFVAAALVGMVVGILHIGFSLYAQSVLDFAGASLARSFQTGSIRSVTNINDPGVRSVSVCPALQNLLDCGAVSVVTYPVADYTGDTSNAGFDPGGPRSLMVVKLTYTSPIPGWPVLNGFGSTTASPMLITSKVPYVNEFIN